MRTYIGQLLQLSKYDFQKKTNRRNQLALAESRKMRHAILSAIPRKQKMEIFNPCLRLTKPYEDKSLVQRPKGDMRVIESTVGKGSPMYKVWNDKILSGTRVTDIALKFSSLKLYWRSSPGKRSVGHPLVRWSDDRL